MKTRIVLAGTLALALLAAFAMPAFAAGPTLTPETIVKEGFEDSSYAPGFSVAPFAVAPAVSSAWWAPTNKLGGRTSLWCAGTKNPTLFPALYPVGSGGQARLDLAALADYYAAKLSFSYNQPTLGLADSDSLTVHWYDAAGSQYSGVYHSGPSWFPLTAASVWRAPQYWLTTPWSSVNLSRRAGSMWLQWFDQDEAGQTPAVGQGPAIDDLAVTGWRYGPVRDLTATIAGGSVRLDWRKPATAVGSSVDDSRAMTYKVWRADDTAATYIWTELTPPAGVSGLTLTNTPPAPGRYRYVVQAWDAQGHFGQVRVPNETAVVKFSSPAPVVDRIQGASRLQTAIEASKRAYPRGISATSAVVVTDGWDWQSALPGSALAGATDGPLLLVNYSQPDLPQDVADELVRLGARKAYLIGSDAHIQQTVRSQIANLGISITSIDGGDAAMNSRLVAEQMKSLRGGTTGGIAFLARDDDFADALSASGLAAFREAPIILTNKTTLSTSAGQALKSLKPGTIVICGSNLAVSDGIQNTVTSGSGYGVGTGSWAHTVLRKEGLSRVDTSKAIAEYGRQTINPSPKRVFVSYGWNYPDALGGGVLAAIDGGSWNPLLLIHQTYLDTTMGDFVEQTPSLHDGGIFGSTLAVGGAVDGQLKGKLHQ